MRAMHLLLALSLLVGGCFVDRTGTRTTSEMDGAVDLDARPPMGDAAGCPGVDIRSDPSNCGECDNRCLEVPNAASTCVDSRCGIECAFGHGDCDADPTTGCEILTDRNPESCGACGNDCAAATPPPNTTSAGCAGGACQFDCMVGWGDCDSDLANGCETDLNDTRAHCGRCGFTCPLAANSQPRCSMGMCDVRCDSTRFRDCNHDPVDGCEVDVLNDLACGLCPRDPGVVVCLPGGCGCDMSGCRCASILP